MLFCSKTYDVMFIVISMNMNVPDAFAGLTFVFYPDYLDEHLVALKSARNMVWIQETTGLNPQVLKYLFEEWWSKLPQHLFPSQ